PGGQLGSYHGYRQDYIGVDVHWIPAD
ncbi:MAG: hypothetical protein EZS28_047542, partial [Streblomastix strix]